MYNVIYASSCVYVRVADISDYPLPLHVHVCISLMTIFIFTCLFPLTMLH